MKMKVNMFQPSNGHWPSHVSRASNFISWQIQTQPRHLEGAYFYYALSFHVQNIGVWTKTIAAAEKKTSNEKNEESVFNGFASLSRVFQTKRNLLQ